MRSDIWQCNVDGCVIDAEGNLVAVIGSPDEMVTKRFREIGQRVASLPDLELVLFALLHCENTACDDRIEFDVGRPVRIAAKRGMPDFTHPDWPAARDALIAWRAQYIAPPCPAVLALDGYTQDLRCA